MIRMYLPVTALPSRARRVLVTSRLGYRDLGSRERGPGRAASVTPQRLQASTPQAPRRRSVAHRDRHRSVLDALVRPPGQHSQVLLVEPLQMGEMPFMPHVEFVRGRCRTLDQGHGVDRASRHDVKQEEESDEHV